jgi:hypothetical protein
MANYIEISQDGGATWKRLKVLADGDAVDGAPDTPGAVIRALNGTTLESVGVSKIRWFYRCLVFAQPTDSAFADVEWVKSMFASGEALKLKPFNGNSYGVVIQNRAAHNLRCITFNHTGQNAAYTVEIDLIEQ